jgi:hypothetical protein
MTDRAARDRARWPVRRTKPIRAPAGAPGCAERTRRPPFVRPGAGPIAGRAPRPARRANPTSGPGRRPDPIRAGSRAPSEPDVRLSSTRARQCPASEARVDAPSEADRRAGAPNEARSGRPVLRGPRPDERGAKGGSPDGLSRFAMRSSERAKRRVSCGLRAFCPAGMAVGKHTADNTRQEARKPDQDVRIIAARPRG